MPVQSQINNTNLPFILFGIGVMSVDEVLLTDAGRTEPLLCNTVMAQNAATKKWVPLTDVTATNGTALATAIYVGADIDAATIVAGDVTDLPLLVGDAGVDIQQVVFDAGTVTPDTVVATGTVEARTVRTQLKYSGIHLVDTDYASGFVAS